MRPLDHAVAQGLAAGCALVLAGCGGDGGSAGPSPSQVGGAEFGRDCAGVASPAAPDVDVPEGFPVYEGWVGTAQAMLGKTRVVFGRAPAPDDVGVVQARQRELLEAAGLRIVSTDREGQAEAEISFDGATEGSVQITPLCRGTVTIRYRIIR